MPSNNILHFGTATLDIPGLVRRTAIATVVKAAASGAIGALLVDARSAEDLFRAQELLRTLYDDPRSPRRLIHPHRVLALIASGDVEAAFALGRYGLAGVVEERALDGLAARLQRVLASEVAPSPLTTPALAPSRPARLGPRADAELPTVVIGYRHAPETLAGLARYVSVLRAHEDQSTVFADVATLIERMVAEGLTCQTDLASKAGATHSGQFIGSFEFYRALRRTRYARIPDHPEGAIAMDVFIAIDEVLHEVLHLLFLANSLRAGLTPGNTRLAEELSVTWWQAVVHNRVFPEWLADRHILEINDDFMLSEANQVPRGFWTVGNVFDQYEGYPWVPHVLAQLPQRASYIGQRPDFADVLASYAARPEARFLGQGAAERLAVTVDFDRYPDVPPTLRIGAV